MSIYGPVNEIEELNVLVAPYFKATCWQDIEFTADRELDFAAEGYDVKDETGKVVIHTHNPREYGPSGKKWVEMAESAAEVIRSYLTAHDFTDMVVEVTQNLWPDFAITVLHMGGREEGSPEEDQSLL